MHLLLSLFVSNKGCNTTDTLKNGCGCIF